MSKVFILNDGGYDYTAAEKFGEIIICSRGFVKKDISYCYRLLHPYLEKAEYDDYIVLTGLVSLCCAATAILIERFGRVNFLIHKGDYYEPQVLVTCEGT